MNYREMKEAVESAENTLRMADCATNDLVRLLRGRLRNVKGYTGIENLKDLKKELKEFNAVTGEWKS